MKNECQETERKGSMTGKQSSGIKKLRNQEKSGKRTAGNRTARK